MKRLLYFALAAICTTILASCSEKDTYEPIEFSAMLSPTNTYRVGEPVEFNITGNANYVTFWNGEGQHEYKFRDRTSVALEDIEGCELELSVGWRYGKNGILKALISNNGQPLKGDNRDADLAMVRALEADNFSGWTDIEYTLPPSGTGGTTKVKTLDIKDYASNFSFMVWCKPTMSEASAQSNFFVNAFINLKIKGLPTQTINVASQLGLKAFSPVESRKDNAYALGTSNDSKGYVQFTTEPQITFIGQNSGLTKEQCENFVISTPQPLNIVTPDTGTNIKGYADILRIFKHTYSEPGQYTVTFVARTGNYIGQSETVQSLTFNIIEPVE